MDFTNWEGYTGYYPNNPNINCCPNYGIVPGRHTIISSSITDSYTCGGLIVPPQGATTCAKLGNEQAGKQAEKLVYTFTVDQNSSAFIYRYAIVLQDPNHPLNAQPYFSIKVLDSVNTIIDSICGLYEVYATAGIPGFQTCLVNNKTIRWKDWTTVGINLNAYMGQTIRIEFTTFDCAYGAHFGYAYILAECGAMTIDMSYCFNTDSVVLKAPDGFEYLWSTGDTTQTITIHNPIIGSSYFCNVTSVTGCGFPLYATITQSILHPDFTFTNDTCSKTVNFTDLSSISNSNIDSWLWDFGDNTTSSLQNPAHIYPGAGSYDVTLQISTFGGCDSTISRTVNIGNVPTAQFSVNDTCQSNEVFFNNTSYSNDSIVNVLWVFDDGTNTDTINWSTMYIYDIPGNYSPTLYVTNNNGCKDSISHDISIFPSPFADFSFVNPACSGQPTTITFTGTYSLWTEFFWDFDGGVVNLGSGPGPYIVSWLDSGSYNIQLMITDTVCNSISDTSKTILVNLSPIADAGADTTICLGHTINLTGGSGDSYLWMPNEGLNSVDISNPEATPDHTTIYTLSVSQNGCISSDEVVITVYELSPVSVSNDTSICNGTDAQLWASGGVFYEWTPAISLSNPSIANPIATPTSTQTYLVTISDSSACQATEDVKISLLNAPSAAFSINNNNICIGENIIVNFTGNSSTQATYIWDFDGANIIYGSGNGPYIISWSNVGNYSISLYVTDLTCGSDTSIKTVNVNPNPFANAGQDVTICLGESTSLSVGSGSTYNWSPSMGLSATNISNPTASPGTTTTYTVVVWDNGCSATDNVIVEVIDLSSSYTSSDTSICLGQSTQLLAHGGTYYLWAPSSGLNNSNVYNPVASPTSTSTYYVTISDTNGCSYIDSVSVSVDIPPTSTFSVSPDTICSGTATTITYTGNAQQNDTYIWNFNSGYVVSGSGQGPYNIIYQNPGIYNLSLSVNNNNNCISNPFIVPLTVNPTPAANAGNDTSLCLGNSFQLAGGGGTTYTWSPSTGLSSTNIANPTASPLQTITYSVTVTTGACSATDDITINVSPLHPASACVDTGFCAGSNVTLSANGGTNYHWSPASGLSSVSVSNPVANPQATTTYTVTITSASGCYATDAVVVSVFNVPSSSFTISQNPCCIENPLLVNYTGNAFLYDTYNWNFNGANILSGSGQGPYSIQWTTSGNFAVSLTVENFYCSSPLTEIPITVYQVIPDVIDVTDVLCYGDNIGSITVAGTGGIAPYTYHWSNSQTNLTISNLSSGTYTVSISDINGCLGTESIIIAGPEEPLSLLLQPLNTSCHNTCNGQIISTISGGTTPYSFLWNTVPVQTNSSAYSLCSGSYSLTISDNNGCIITSNAYVDFNTSVDANFNSDEVFGYIPFTVNFNYTGYGASAYFWDFGDGSTSNVQNPSHVYTTTGTYTVTLTTNSMEPDYCIETYSIVIIAEDISFIDVPNVFTPNNDGINDFYEIKSNYLGFFKLTIFNRWGKIIYETNSIDSFWDGNNKHGNPASEGTYYYIIDALGKDNVKYSLNGFISLIR